jgi:hypothetical protein
MFALAWCPLAPAKASTSVEKLEKKMDRAQKKALCAFRQAGMSLAEILSHISLDLSLDSDEDAAQDSSAGSNSSSKPTAARATPRPREKQREPSPPRK